MPTYNDTPLGAQRKNESQPLIQQNFTSIQTAFNQNHTALSTAAPEAGKHKFIQMPEQGAAPGTAVNELALYSRQGAHSPTASQLCFQRENGDIIEFTAGTLGGTGWTRLPSGLLLKWGVGLATGRTLVTFPTTATDVAFTNIFSIQVTTWYVNSNDGDGFVRLDAFVAPWAKFKVFASHRTTTGSYGPIRFTYLAIGV